jgi:glycosyltransferase involved in cell wall biosynthesis
MNYEPAAETRSYHRQVIESLAIDKIAELRQENAHLRSELDKIQDRLCASGAVTACPVRAFDAFKLPFWKKISSNFKAVPERIARRLDFLASRFRQPPPVLVVSDHLPLHDQQSGGLRQKTIIEILGELGFPVLFSCSLTKDRLPGILCTDEGRMRYEDGLRGAGVVEFAYGLEEIDACLQRHGQFIQRALIALPHVATDLMPLVRLRAPQASIFYDMVDFHALRLLREAEVTQDPLKRDEALAMEATELDLARNADMVITISDAEKNLLLEKVPEAVVETIPNIFRKPKAITPGPHGRKDILFLAGFWHKPNGDGAIWFVNEIWPKIRALEPAARFVIAGAHIDSRIEDLGQTPGVKILGYVNDLESLFNTCRVFVAPLRYGAGMKGKVGHSLVYGLPLVSTQIGAEGIPMEPGHDFLLAETPDGFALSVVQLLRDDDLWIDFQRRGQALIATNFSTETISKQIASLFNV